MNGISWPENQMSNKTFLWGKMKKTKQKKNTFYDKQLQSLDI